MANTFTPVIKQILVGVLPTLRREATMPRLINTAYSTDAGRKGSVVEIALPPTVATNAVTPGHTAPNTAGLDPTVTNIPMDDWREAPFDLTDKEEAEVMEGTVPAAAESAIVSLMEYVNGQIFTRAYPKAYGFTGTPGTTPFGSATVDATQARKVLNTQLAPKAGRRFVMDPEAEANALELRAFQDASWRNSAQGIVEGQIGRALGFDFFMDQQVPTHTAGTSSGHLVNSGSLAIGDTVIPADTGSGTILVGDIVTFAGHTQTYTVTSALAAGSFSISPGLVAAPADNAAITVKASHTVNLAFQRDAIGFGSRVLMGGDPDTTQSIVDPVTGLVIRLERTREYKQTRYSFDILFGVECVRPELIARVAG